MPEQVEHGTSHISIVDGYGNAIAMTTTIEDQFGSRLMTRCTVRRLPAEQRAHRLQLRAGRCRGQTGRQPRAARQAPALVDGAHAGVRQGHGQLVMSGGSPGGALIIHFTAKTLYGVLNWGLNAQQAIDLPNFGSLNGPTMLEEKRFPPATVQALRRRGARGARAGP
jgi:gamma-glutamyltranspeptidase/glutathione hydrolase